MRMDSVRKLGAVTCRFVRSVSSSARRPFARRPSTKASSREPWPARTGPSSQERPWRSRVPALLGGPRATTTAANGTYLFLNLPVGRYTVTASLTGFKTIVRENIEIVLRTRRSRVDLVLPVGEVKETVTVSAAGPIVDTKAATVERRFDSEMLAKLPTSRDAFYDLALTAPGMFEGSGAPSQTTEFQSPTAYGSATNENVFLINGVDATSPRAGSFGVARQRQLRRGRGGADRRHRLEGRVRQLLRRGHRRADQVRQQHVPRHAARSTRSSETRRATNPTRRGFRDGLPLRGSRETRCRARRRRTGRGSATLGGPITKDKLWFFGAFNYLRNAGLRPRWSLENESWDRYADAKVSAAPFTNHRAWASYHYENNDGNGWSWGSEPQWDTTMTYGSKTKNHTPSAQWQMVPEQPDHGQREVSRLLDRRPALRSAERTRPSRVHQLVEVGRLRHQWRVPVRRGAEVEPPDGPGRPLALRRGVPRRSTTSSSASSTRRDAATGRVATSRTT